MRNWKNYLVFCLIFSVTVGILSASDTAQVMVYSNKANIWYFHSPSTGLNFYLMKVWPGTFLLTKFGPPEFSLSRNVFLQVAAGPDFNTNSKNFENLFYSFTVDGVLTVKGRDFLGVFVNEVGVNKDGKGIYLFRHTLTYKSIVGFRYMTCGSWDGESDFFRAGPTIQLGKVQLWVANDLKNEEWLMELCFTVSF